MMTSQRNEIFSFISKLTFLSGCGINANLNLNSFHGNLYVNFNVDLGKVEQQFVHNDIPSPRRYKPSQIRRRRRRRQAQACYSSRDSSKSDGNQSSEASEYRSCEIEDDNEAVTMPLDACTINDGFQDHGQAHDISNDLDFEEFLVKAPQNAADDTLATNYYLLCSSTPHLPDKVLLPTDPVVSCPNKLEDKKSPLTGSASEDEMMCQMYAMVKYLHARTFPTSTQMSFS